MTTANRLLNIGSISWRLTRERGSADLEGTASSKSAALISAKLHTYLAICILVTGALALLGWTANSPLLKSVVPGLIAMKANTAAGIIAIGFGLLALPGKTRAPETHRARRAGCSRRFGSAIHWGSNTCRICVRHLFRHRRISVYRSGPGVSWSWPARGSDSRRPGMLWSGAAASPVRREHRGRLCPARRDGGALARSRTGNCRLFQCGWLHVRR